MRVDQLKRLGSTKAPAGFPERVLSQATRRRLIVELGHDEIVMLRDVVRAAAIDRATRQPHDNHLVRHLFGLAHLFAELAEES